MMMVVIGGRGRGRKGIEERRMIIVIIRMIIEHRDNDYDYNNNNTLLFTQDGLFSTVIRSIEDPAIYYYPGFSTASLVLSACIQGTYRTR